ncbi:gag-like protein [Lasius niger]|uniref:Gag-like protein n=1 Tax=Lasius niger TaxID=67767 RepID=A0A0J7MVU7_LASNI|nr:gag-like protein [Lasius niger]
MLEERKGSEKTLQLMEREEETEEIIPPRKPLGKEGCSFAKKEKRTRKWVTRTSLPSGDGEAPMTPRTTEEFPHPPTGGETPPVREEERIEDDEMDIVREEEEFVHKEEGFPPFGAPGRGEPGTLHIVQGRTERIILLGTTKREDEERERAISFIAKLEGIVERILDKGLGVPIPSFRERKEAEKAAKMQQQQQQHQQHQQPKTIPPLTTAKAANKTSPVTEKAAKGTSTKLLVKSVEVPKKKIKVLPVTALNPPERPATTRTPIMGRANGGSGKGKGPETAKQMSQEAKPRCRRGRRPAKKAQTTEKRAKTATTATTATTPATTAKKVLAKKEGKQQTSKQRKEPQMAAVIVTCPSGRYEETIREARQKVKLESLDISGVKIRRAITGALVFEVPGKGSHKLADRLAA